MKRCLTFSAVILLIAGCGTLHFGPSVDFITITRAPNKTMYIQGEVFDPAGLVITGTYADKSSADVTADTELSGYTAGSPGLKTITATYRGAKAAFTVVIAPEGTTEENFAAVQAFKDAHAGVFSLTTDTIAGENTKDIESVLAEMETVGSIEQVLLEGDKVKLKALLQFAANMTVSMLQYNTDPSSWWGAYQEAFVDLSPYTRTLEAGKTYTVTITGTSPYTMNNFTVGLAEKHDTVWHVLADPNATTMIGVKPGSFTYIEQYMIMENVVITRPGTHWLWLLSLQDRAPNKQHEDFAYAITDLRVRFEEAE
ncbi:hypothetical protein AGMMS4952_13820 [Spirochaetia bacterium]|nr:hypothetical protein AGMMS4952_13820 [Spirochaetia bacterium]